MTITETATAVTTRWTITTTTGVSISGHLPPWSPTNPSQHGVSPDKLALTVEDVEFVRYYPSVKTALNQNTPGGRHIGEGALLCPQINCDPFSENPIERTPHANVEMVEGWDDWIEYLDPQGVADLAAKLRAQADVLDQVAADLSAARADWAANGQASE